MKRTYIKFRSRYIERISSLYWMRTLVILNELLRYTEWGHSLYWTNFFVIPNELLRYTEWTSSLYWMNFFVILNENARYIERTCSLRWTNFLVHITIIFHSTSIPIVFFMGSAHTDGDTAGEETIKKFTWRKKHKIMLQSI